MHYVGTLDEIGLHIPQFYAEHSQGYTRASLVDHTRGSVHMGLGLCQLASEGRLSAHVHSYEEAFFILEGEVLCSIDGKAYQFGPGDYGIIQVGVPHAWHNVSDQPVRWLEMLAAQPKPPERGHDTFFLKQDIDLREGVKPDWRDPRTRCLGHFDDAQLPPSGKMQMEGDRGGNIHGISLKMLIDHTLGAQLLTLFMVQFAQGGEGVMHDHPFEESYFLLSGEAEALLDGQRYHVKAGNVVWTGVGGTHAFFQRGDVPVRWIETQAPQPPRQHSFRFPAEWDYLAEKLEN